MAGFRNNIQDHRRLKRSRKKLPEEGYWKDFHNFSDFKDASRNLFWVFFKKDS
jgi:hypothetical protein